jgi:hypothetical protein
MARSLLHLLLGVFGFCQFASGQAETSSGLLLLEPGIGIHEISPQLRWHHDVDATATAMQMFERAAEGRFEPLPGGRPTFGFQSGAFWFHLQVENRDSAESRRLLVQQYPLSDSIELHLRYPDGRVTRQVSGDRLPFDQRAVKHRQPNFWVDLPLGQRVEMLVRVESESSMQVPLVLYTQAAFTALSSDAQIGIGLYYGILIALFFYNLILWATLRDASYFWYMVHISAFGLVLFCLNGLAFEYLWPRGIWLQDKAVPISICLAQVGMQQFARHFLELDQRWRRADWISLGLIGAFVLLGASSSKRSQNDW